ncbi:MAG: chloride channel protein [Prevotellaceae bacterium]|jgi:CIC family chloride channel protein|nr:chloride channel protein [Prevotellaceae bacterium]
MAASKHKKWYEKMIDWRFKNVSTQHFVLFLSLLTGVLCSVAACLLKESIHFIQHLVTNIAQANQLNYGYLVFPAVGILITSLFVRYIVKDDIGHGVTRIMYAISQRKSYIKLHNIWTSMAGSLVTIGFGGSVGAEAPIVLTGSAIGSNLGKLFKLDQKTVMLLVGCGASGAIAGIFKAPIAGFVFTLEVLMLDMTMTSIVPLLISSISATAMTYILTNKEFMFDFVLRQEFSVERIPHLLLLGVVCGLVSLYFTRGMNWLETQFRKIDNLYIKWALGGTVLGLLIFVFPPLYGEGYDTINALLAGNVEAVFERSPFQAAVGITWVVVLYLSLIILLKAVASTCTTSGGGVGGLFAPSLFAGCITGFVLARVLNNFGMSLPESNFALAGMSGIISGVMHAPLMGIFLIAELTGGYDLLMTLMIVSVVSYVTIIVFEPYSLYAMRLAAKGELITHHKDKAVLTLLKMENVLETDLKVVQPEMTLGEFVKVISKSKRNIFPVENPDTKELIGIVSLDEVRNIMFRPEFYKRFTMKQLMTYPPAIINVNMPMEKVMDIFEDSGAWNLPVVDDEKRYMGFVSKSKIFNSYRHVLVHFSDE